MELTASIRANKKKRAAQLAHGVSDKLKEAIGEEWDTYHRQVDRYSHIKPGETLAEYGESKLANIIEGHRNKDAQYKNNVRKTVRGTKSKYRLTGLTHTPEWDAQIARTIKERGGHAAAEARALERWLKRSPHEREEMVKWKEIRDIEKKRKELEAWLKKTGKKK